MIRNVLAWIAGLAVAIGAISLVQKLGHTIYPPPSGLNVRDAAAMEAYVSQLPFVALLFPIFSYFLGSLLGGLVACRIGARRPVVFTGVIGLILLAFTVANLIQIPHPHWFSALAVAAVIAGAWLATQLSRNESPDPGAP
jgi:hypothetical protein